MNNQSNIKERRPGLLHSSGVSKYYQYIFGPYFDHERNRKTVVSREIKPKQITGEVRNEN